MLPFLTANRSPILMCRGPVRYKEPAGRPHTPPGHARNRNCSTKTKLLTYKHRKRKKNCFFVAVVDALQKQKKNEGATIEEPTSVRQVTHPHLAYIPGRLMGHNENTHTMLRSAQLNRGSSQFFPEMSSLFGGGREFSPAAGRARRTVTPEGNWVFVICNLLCFTEI